MSHWGGDGPPLAPSPDSPHQSLYHDIPFIILSLSIIIQQLSAVLASQLSSSLSPASSSLSTWLVQALSNISATTYYLSFAQPSTVTTAQSPHTNSNNITSLSPSPSSSPSALPAPTTSLSPPPLSPASSPPPSATTSTLYTIRELTPITSISTNPPTKPKIARSYLPSVKPRSSPPSSPPSLSPLNPSLAEGLTDDHVTAQLSSNGLLSEAPTSSSHDLCCCRSSVI